MTEIVFPEQHNSGQVQRHQETDRRWTIDQLRSSWLAAHNTSAATFAEYARDFDQYRQWCEAVSLDVLGVGLPEVQMYGEHLARVTSTHGKPLAPRTRARKLNAVSSFYLFAARAGAVSHNPARDVQRPRYDRTYSPTQSLNEDEARRMLAAAPTLEQRVLDPRALVLVLSMMIDLGARVSEVCSINIDDMGTRRGLRTITMHAKGSKVRVRPITAQLEPVLDRWREQRPEIAGEDALIVDRRGKRVTRGQIAKLLKRLALAAGVSEPDRVTPHSCRHAFNEIAKARGASLEARRDALGHVSTDTTRLYDHQGADLATDPAHLVSAATVVPDDVDD